MRIALAVLLLAAAGPAAAAERAASQSTLRAFGLSGEAMVLGLPEAAARQALEDAQAEIRAIEALADPAGEAPGGLGRLNGAAGAGQEAVEPALADLLARALSFCSWAEGAGGPLGGRLYRLWDAAGKGAPEPDPAVLSEAAASAGCNRLRLVREPGRAELAAGSIADLRGFAPGFALDQAIEAMKRRGAANAWVSLGGVQRGIGVGPEGRGWPARLPAIPGLAPPLAAVLLRDRALAVVMAGDPRPHLDLRSGRPAGGVLALLAATELAVDAQGLTTVLVPLGSRRGQFRLGSLRPRPSVLWALGSGQGLPLLIDYRWSELVRGAGGAGAKTRP